MPDQAFPGIIGTPGYGNSTFFVGPNGDNIPIEFSPGMTLRDYFAAQAMGSLLIEDAAMPVGARALLAYRVADAMLAERNKGGA